MKALLLILLIFPGLKASANVCPFGTKIFYGNGMFNSYLEAKGSSEALQAIDLSGLESLKNPPSFGLAFNRNDSKILNILSVLVQKLNNNYRTAWRLIFGLEIPPGITALDLASLFLEPIQGNTERMTEQYRQTLKEGKRILLISHSQGNFFAEEAIQSIADWRSPYEIGIGNVRVATPAYSTYSFPYTTFEDDFIIKSVRHLAGAPDANLPKIGSGPAPDRDPLGHNFAKAYLGTQASKDKIQADIISVAKKTQFPFPGNAFSIEITSKDDDGLVFLVDVNKDKDRDQFHQDEKNRDLQSYGVECKKIEEGNYSITLMTTFIQKDRCPCNFSVKVKAGDLEKTYNASYRMERRSDGHSYHVVDGLIPALFVTRKDGNFEVEVNENPYPAIMVH